MLTLPKPVQSSLLVLLMPLCGACLDYGQLQDASVAGPDLAMPDLTVDIFSWPDLAVEVDLATRALGADCTSGDQCSSGNCVDSVCCDKPEAMCNGCRVCDATGNKGRCTNIPAGTDPLNFCTANEAQCSLADCNGDGSCAVPDETFCVPDRCDASESVTSLCKSGLCMDTRTPCSMNFACMDANTCGTTCTTDAHCAPGYFCYGTNCLPLVFGAPTNFVVKMRPQGIAAGDFNGDGKQDLLVSNTTTAVVSVLLGAGDGTFSAGMDVPTSSGPQALLVGNFTGSAALDFVVACRTGNSLNLFTGVGDGTFMSQAPIINASISSPVSLAIGKFSVTSNTDLAIASAGNNSATILEHSGGNFILPTANTTLGVPVGVAVGDLDGDMIHDVVVATTLDVEVMRGQNDRSLLPPSSHTAGSSPTSIVIANLDGDGKRDLVVANKASDNVSVLMNTSQGVTISFANATNYMTGTAPSFVVAGDFSGNQLPDIAVANSGGTTVTVLSASGAGTFISTHDYAAGDSPSAIAAADFNGDSKIDLAVANTNGNNISILLSIRP